MANTVAYSDSPLEKHMGIDSSEDTRALSCLLEMNIVFSWGSRPVTNENNVETFFDDRRKVLFGLVLRGSPATWSISQAYTITWDAE